MSQRPTWGPPAGEREASGGWGQRAPLSTWPHGAPPSGGEEPWGPLLPWLFFNKQLKNTMNKQFIVLKFIFAVAIFQQAVEKYNEQAVYCP